MTVGIFFFLGTICMMLKMPSLMYGLISILVFFLATAFAYIDGYGHVGLATMKDLFKTDVPYHTIASGKDGDDYIVVVRDDLSTNVYALRIGAPLPEYFTMVNNTPTAIALPPPSAGTPTDKK
jgi:hypothetical protein